MEMMDGVGKYAFTTVPDNEIKEPEPGRMHR
jgi:hypothetical protein